MMREYPHLTFRRNWTLTNKALFLLGQCDAFVKAIDNTPIMPERRAELMKISLRKGAQATTAIEGNTLTDDDIDKMMRGEKMPPSKEYQEIEVKNIIDAFNKILAEVIVDNSSRLISIELLREFHEMVGRGLGEHFEAIPGEIRTSDVIVGKYRCPDYRDVPELLGNLCSWLKSEFGFDRHEQTFSEVVIQAIVTHIYIEWIHPFGDGNGRTGRLVEFYILLRGGNPDLASHILSNHYNETRTNYYRQIESATQQRDLTAFIEYALEGFRDGLEQTLDIIQESQFKNSWQKLIYDRFHDVNMSNKEVFKRQRSLALNLPLFEPFTIDSIPDLSIPLARAYASLSNRTILRDVEKLVDLELVDKEGPYYYADVAQLNRMMAQKRIKKM